MRKFLKSSIISASLLLICTILFTAPAQAQVDQHDNVGLGVLLGDPSGISYKNYFNSTNAMDAAVGWSLRNDGGLYIHADYLWHNYELFQDMEGSVEKGLVGLYFGVGGRLFISDESDLGVRVPVGVNYMFENDPLEIFIEVVPILDLVPSTHGDFGGGIGIRYYF
jgi:hypothetical protein